MTVRQMKTYAVIFAGGAGERLWPLSTREKPKQFLALIDEEPLIKNTVARLEGLLPKERIFIQTIPSYREKIAELLPDFAERIWLEPAGRDTGPAVALAALRLYDLDPESIMLTLWSDHFIGRPEELKRAFRQAIEIAQKGDFLVEIGIKPDRPETTLGYLELLEKLPDSEAFRAKHKEKPDLKTAQKYLERGSVLWNAGLFAWPTKTILAAFSRHAPEIDRPLMEIRELISTHFHWESEEVKEAFARMPRISLDYAVSEKAENLVGLEADPAWDDIGSWQRLYALLPKAENGNVVKGRVVALESRDSLMLNQNSQPLATMGIKDLIIVATDRGILVADKNSDPAKIKEILKQVQNDGGEVQPGSQKG